MTEASSTTQPATRDTERPERESSQRPQIWRSPALADALEAILRGDQTTPTTAQFTLEANRVNELTGPHDQPA